MVRQRLAAVAFEVLPPEAAILDTDGLILLVNEAWRRFGRENGAGAACGPGMNYLEVCGRAAAAGDQVAGAVGAALTAVLSGGAPRAALDYPCDSPTATRWFHLRAQPMPGRRRVLLLHDDITGRVTENAELRHQASHDPLTELPNRQLLYDRLAAALHAGDRRHVPDVTVLVVDLDGFKAVNDEYGHVAGDLLLTIVARRLTSLVRAGDTVARWGGDEFVLVLPDCAAATTRRMVERVRAVVAEPVILAQHRLVLTASIGLSVGRPGRTPQELLQSADRSLRAAKRHRAAGRGPFLGGVDQPP